MAASLTCSRCDGPVNARDVREGFAVRLDGHWVCGVCIEHLPPRQQASIAKARVARGLGLHLRYLPHPRHAEYRLFAFTDATSLMGHVRGQRLGHLPSPQPLGRLATSRLLPWSLATAAALIALGGIAFVISAAPSAPPLTAPLAPPAAALVATTNNAPLTPPVPLLPAATPTAEAPPTEPPRPAALPAPALTAPAPQAAMPAVAAELPAALPPPATTIAPRWDVLAAEAFVLHHEPHPRCAPTDRHRPPVVWPLLPAQDSLLRAAMVETDAVSWQGRYAMSIAVPAGATGVVLALHGGPSEPRTVDLWSAQNPSAPLGQLRLAAGWESLAIPGTGTLIIADQRPATDAPFWCAGGVAAWATAPTAEALPLMKLPLVPGHDRRLKALIAAVERQRGAAFDARQFRVALDTTHVEDGRFRRWQTPLRASLERHLGETPPNGTVQLVTLWPPTGDAWRPLDERTQVLFFGLEGRDADFAPLQLPAHLRDFQAMFRERNPRAGQPGGVISIPILGNALASTPPSSEWKSVIALLQRNGDPWIDLRDVPAPYTHHALAQAIAATLFNLHYLKEHGISK